MEQEGGHEFMMVKNIQALAIISDFPSPELGFGVLGTTKETQILTWANIIRIDWMRRAIGSQHAASAFYLEPNLKHIPSSKRFPIQNMHRVMFAIRRIAVTSLENPVASL